MLINSAALLGFLMLAESASAHRRRQSTTRDRDVGSRVVADGKIGDQCHPAGTYTLGGSSLIPPCLSEQAISLKCEVLTQVGSNATSEQWKGYRDCLLGQGSSYVQDQAGCRACKVAYSHHSEEQDEWLSKTWAAGRKAFVEDCHPNKNIWEYVRIVIDGSECRSKANSSEPRKGWDCWNQLPKGTFKAARNESVSEYYKNPPKSQGIGTFALNGKTYPGISTTKLTQTTYQSTDNLGLYSSARVEGNKYSYNTTTSLKTVTEYRQIQSISTFTTPDSFTILPVISKPVPVKENPGTAVPLSKDKVAQLPIASCGSCEKVAVPIGQVQKSGVQNAKPIEPASAAVCNQALRDLTNMNTISLEVKETLLRNTSIVSVKLPSGVSGNGLAGGHDHAPNHSSGNSPGSTDSTDLQESPDGRNGKQGPTPSQGSPGSEVDGGQGQGDFKKPSGSRGGSNQGSSSAKESAGSQGSSRSQGPPGINGQVGGGSDLPHESGSGTGDGHGSTGSQSGDNQGSRGPQGTTCPGSSCTKSSSGKKNPADSQNSSGSQGTPDGQVPVAPAGEGACPPSAPGDASQAIMKVTVCRLPDETDCKTYYY